jgi:hypothetical protein
MGRPCGQTFGNWQQAHSWSRAAIPSLERSSPNFVEPLQARALARSAAGEGVQRGKERRRGVGGGLRGRVDPHGVRPERLEKEAKRAEVLLEGPHLGGQVLRQRHRHRAFE